MNSFIEFLKQLMTNVGLKIVLGIIILIVGYKITKWLVKLLEKTRGFNKLDKGIQGFLSSFIKIALYALIVSTAAICFGVPGTAFITVFTSAGVAIGLALQGALSNFAGGLMILIFHPFKVGDFVECEGAKGTVSDITVIYTKVKTIDNTVVTVPNGKITNANIINFSKERKRRVDLTIPASYTADVELVKKTLLEVADSLEKVLKDPAPVVRLFEMSSSSLNYVYRVWCKNADYWDVYFDSMEAIKKAFDEKGIEIPYSKLDVKIMK